MGAVKEVSPLAYLGPLVSYRVLDRAVLLEAGPEKVQITAVLPGVVHVRLYRGGCYEPYPEEATAGVPVACPEAIDPAALAAPAPPVAVEEAPDHLLVDAAGVRVRVQRHPLRLAFLAPAGGEVLLADAGGLCYDGWQVGVEFAARPDDRFYGLGQAGQHEGAVAIEASGKRYPVWNLHLPGPSRFVVPVVVGRRGYGVLVDNAWPAELDFTGTRPGRGGTWRYTAQGGAMAYFFILGPDLPGVLDRLTQLTGRPALPPLWTFGLLQSKFGYRSQAEVEELARTFRSKGIPCDAIVLDLYWFRHMGDLRFDRTAFPQPRRMIRGLRRQGFRTIVIEEPYLAVGSRLYREAVRRGLVARRPDAEGGGPWVFPWWHGEAAALADFSNPATQEWWARQHRDLVRLGVAGWWTDLTEPELHLPGMIHHGGPAAAVHNLEGLRMIAAVHRAQSRYAPGQRCFIMSRSGWVGMQRYGATTWSGDVHPRWEALAVQPALGLNMGMVGVPGWNSDIGGFTQEGECTPELYLRWLQFGTFTPICRPHGAHQPREPWAFGPEVEAAAVAALRLRYRLLPYTYTCAWEAHRTGAPLMRPLVLEYPDDPHTWHLGDQYLWGRDLLVAPVLAPGARERRVYLPAGTWYDFWTGRRYTGGRWVTVPAPLERIPLLVRAGALIPMAGRDLETTAGALPWDPLTVAWWPGEGEAQFTLYEDDGETEAYRDGAYTLTPIRAWREGDTLHLVAGPAVGGKAPGGGPTPGGGPGGPPAGEAAAGSPGAGALPARVWQFRVHLPRAPRAVWATSAAPANGAAGAPGPATGGPPGAAPAATGAGAVPAAAGGGAVGAPAPLIRRRSRRTWEAAAAGWWYDPREKALWIRLPKAAAVAVRVEGG